MRQHTPCITQAPRLAGGCTAPRPCRKCWCPAGQRTELCVTLRHDEVWASRNTPEPTIQPGTGATQPAVTTRWHLKPVHRGIPSAMPAHEDLPSKILSTKSPGCQAEPEMARPASCDFRSSIRQHVGRYRPLRRHSWPPRALRSPRTHTVAKLIGLAPWSFSELRSTS